MLSLPVILLGNLMLFSKIFTKINYFKLPYKNLRLSCKFCRSGFTLIETLIAISILMIAVLSVIQLFPLGLKASTQAKNITVATNLAQAKMEEIISDDYDNLTIGTTTEPSLSTIDPDFSNFTRVTVINYVNGDLAIVGQDFGLKKVEVYVGWTSPFSGENSTTSLITLINEF